MIINQGYAWKENANSRGAASSLWRKLGFIDSFYVEGRFGTLFCQLCRILPFCEVVIFPLFSCVFYYLYST